MVESARDHWDFDDDDDAGHADPSPEKSYNEEYHELLEIEKARLTEESAASLHRVMQERGVNVRRDGNTAAQDYAINRAVAEERYIARQQEDLPVTKLLNHVAKKSFNGDKNKAQAWANKTS